MKLRKFIIFVCFILCFSFLYVHNAYAAVASSRISSKDPYTNSIVLSKSGWSSSKNAILVLSEDYSDALTVPVLSKSLKAPVLYTSKEHLNEDVKEEIIRLNAKDVYVVGKNVTDVIVSEIKYLGMNCNVISGSDKYEISAAIGNVIAKNKSNRIILASGDNNMDALSACIVGAREQIPVLLVEKDIIPSSVKEFIESKQIREAYIVGGKDVISDSVSSQFKSYERIFGNDGYQRNIVFLKQFDKDFDFSKLYIVPGNNLLYSIAGSSLAVNENAPVVFVESNFTELSRGFIETKLSDIKQVTVLGDDELISDSVVEQLSDADYRYAKNLDSKTYGKFEEYIQNNYYMECADKSKIKIDKVLVGQKNNDGNSIYIYLDMNRSNYDSLLELLNSGSDSKQSVENWMKSIAEAAKTYYPDKTVNCELWSVDIFSSYPESVTEGNIEFNPLTKEWNTMQKEAGFMITEDGQFMVEWME